MVSGNRRWHLLGLLLCGLATAALAGASAWAAGRVLHESTQVVAVVVIAAAIGVGLLRALERILAEHLGQSYIHQIRRDLLRALLSGRSRTSAGVVIARITNDLTAVRTWVALGIAPLIVAVPLLAGTVVVLAVIHPVLAGVTGAVIVTVALALMAAAGVMYRRAKALRRRRGRLASATTDAVNALHSIRAAGGERRELNHLDRTGRTVVEAAIARARITGILRGVSAGGATLAVAMVIVLAGTGTVTPAQMTAAVLIIGIVAGPLTDLGRVVEYRQNFKAARRILVPALQAADSGPQGDSMSEAMEELTGNDQSLVVMDLELSDGAPIRDMTAYPGDRLVLTSDLPGRCEELVALLAGAGVPSHGDVWIAGVDMNRAPGERRREVIGVASAHDPLPRGSVDRAMRYRVPASHPSDTAALEHMLGLDGVLEALPKGRKTVLTRGGEPLDPRGRALVALVRASLGTPAVLILDRLEARLGPEDMVVLGNLVVQYPGIVMVVGDSAGCAPSWAPGQWRPWRV